MPSVDPTSIGARLRAVRGRRGLRAVATEIGVHAATLSRIENGKQPDMDTFKRICEWLGDDPSIYISSAGVGGESSYDISCSISFSDKVRVTCSEGAALSDLILAASKAICDGDI